MDPYSRARRKNKRPTKLLWLVGIVLVAALAFWFFNRYNRSANSPVSRQQKTSNTRQTQAQPKPRLVNLQPAVDQWLAKQPADYGIVVYDPANKQIIAQHQPDKKY